MRIRNAMAWKASLAAATLLAGGAVFLPSPASAQVTTASLRGQVSGADGAPAAGVTVSARDTDRL